MSCRDKLRGTIVKNTHEVTEILNEAEFCVDIGSFPMSYVTVGYEIESEDGLWKNVNPTSLSIS